MCQPALIAHRKQLTLCLELHVGTLHDAEIRVSREHLGPLAHALQYLRLDGLMCVAVVGQTQESICEAA